MSLKESSISYAKIQFLVAPIFTFYQLNDIILNRKKVSRYLGEYKRVVRDEAYSIEHIQTALQNADQRMRMIILLLASTGARLGSLPGLALRNLVKLPKFGLYRIVFYEGTNNEYYTFTTKECATTGIDTYLQYRQRCGEKISFNENTQRWEPGHVPLIRLQFDGNDILQVRNNTHSLTLNALRRALEKHLIRCGLRQVVEPVQGTFKRKKENGEEEESKKIMYAYKVLDMEHQDEGIKVWEVSRSWSDNIDNLLVKGFLTLEVKRTGAATDTSYLFAPVVNANAKVS